jgi:hypothetical protein
MTHVYSPDASSGPALLGHNAMAREYLANAVDDDRLTQAVDFELPVARLLGIHVQIRPRARAQNLSRRPSNRPGQCDDWLFAIVNVSHAASVTERLARDNTDWHG